MKALVLGGFAHMDTETKQQYWTEVKKKKKFLFTFDSSVTLQMLENSLET